MGDPASDFFSGGNKCNGYDTVVTPGGGGTSVTVVGGYQTLTTLSANATTGSNTIQVNDASGFDMGSKKYISINGTESFQIQTINGNQIELKDVLSEDHSALEPVYLVMAITYSWGMSEGKTCLLRDDNLGLVPAQPVAEDIESLQFRYVMNTGETLDVVPNARLDDIRMIQVTITAITDRDRPDPELAKVGDGFRRRTLTSNIQLRNLLFL